MKRIFVRLITIILVLLLAGCAPSTAIETEAAGTLAVSDAPSASSAIPTAKPTETPILTPFPTVPTEPVFIVSDDVWAGAKELIPPDGDWLAGGFVYVAPGGVIRSPYDAMATHHKFTDDEIYSEAIVLTVEPNESEDFSDLVSGNYALLFQGTSITPAFSQYEMVKEGDIIGTVNSPDFPGTPEQLKIYDLYEYNLYIGCQIAIQEEPFADELTLKDKMMFIVELAKNAQAEPTEED